MPLSDTPVSLRTTSRMIGRNGGSTPKTWIYTSSWARTTFTSIQSIGPPYKLLMAATGLSYTTYLPQVRRSFAVPRSYPDCIGRVFELRGRQVFEEQEQGRVRPCRKGDGNTIFSLAILLALLPSGDCRLHVFVERLRMYRFSFHRFKVAHISLRLPPTTMFSSTSK